MTFDGLNNIITNYIEQKIEGALFLNGEWGLGKTYYVQKSLIPYLKKRKIKVLYVPLFGIKSVEDLNLSILYESYTALKSAKTIFKNATKETALKLISKLPIFKTFIDQTKLLIGDQENKNVLKDLKSVLCLKDTFIILDDIERSNIIPEVLAYVSNLTCSNDNIKFMIVGNEKKINNKVYKDWKEKVICQTVSFECDTLAAIRDILESTKSNLLSKAADGETLLQINEMVEFKHINLRIFKYCCELTSQMFKNKKIKSIKDSNLLACIFLGNVSFSTINSNKHFDFKDNILFTTSVGNGRIPVSRIGYKYITKNVISNEEISHFLDQYNYEQKCIQTDKELKVLDSWATQTEQRIITSINKIFKKLSESDKKLLDAIGIIASKLITLISYDVINEKYFDKYKEILNGLVKRKQIDRTSLQKIIFNESIHNNMIIDSEKARALADNFTTWMKSKLYSEAERCYENTNLKSGKDIENFYEVCRKDEQLIQKRQSFLSETNLSNKISSLYRKGITSDQIQTLRRILSYIYNGVLRNTYIESEAIELDKIIATIDEVKNDKQLYDSVCRALLNFTSNNLKNITQIIHRMSKNRGS